MPEVPIVMPSEIAIVLSSIGVPPAARMPSLTLAASTRLLKLHGIVSIHEWATPDDRLGQVLGGVADPVQIGARGGTLGALGEGARAVLDVKRLRCAHSAGTLPARRGARLRESARSRSQHARRARSRLALATRIWRPGRCMLACSIRARSSAVSAIHLASTSSESGKPGAAKGTSVIGELDAVLAQHLVRRGT